MNLEGVKGGETIAFLVGDFYMFLLEDDPITYKEAMLSIDATFWKQAVNDEMGSIMVNRAWVLIDLPLGSKALGCK